MDRKQARLGPSRLGTYLLYRVLHLIQQEKSDLLQLIRQLLLHLIRQLLLHLIRHLMLRLNFYTALGVTFNADFSVRRANKMFPDKDHLRNNFERREYG